jgi:hypothetical protein
MRGFEDRHQVVPAGSAEVGGVGDGEPHSISHASLLDAPASGADGIVVEIEAVHGDVWVRLGHGDARPAGAARHDHYLREAALGPRPPVKGLLPQVAMSSASW